MAWAHGIIVFILIWWMVFFSVLPWGNHPAQIPESGHADSAPLKPRLGLKVLITTGIATVFSGIAWLIIDANIISFRVP
jgi:predicted secreted protein